MIHFYGQKNSYGEFSNFYPSPLTIQGMSYPTNEHYYQSQKFLGPDSTPRSREYAQIILSQNTPNKTKILAGQRIRVGYPWIQSLNEIIRNYPDVKIRSDWERVKSNVMRTGVFQKFIQNPNLLQALISTGQAELAEHTNRDFYWGDGGDGSGQNMLGQILMETRSLLQKEKIPFSPSPSNQNFWILRNRILMGPLTQEVLNSVQVLVDVSDQNTLRQLFQISSDQDVVIFQNTIFLHLLKKSVSYTLAGLGQGYQIYIYSDNTPQLIQFLSNLFSELYLLPVETFSTWLETFHL